MVLKGRIRTKTRKMAPVIPREVPIAIRTESFCTYNTFSIDATSMSVSCVLENLMGPYSRYPRTSGQYSRPARAAILTLSTPLWVCVGGRASVIACVCGRAMVGMTSVERGRRSAHASCSCAVPLLGRKNDCDGCRRGAVKPPTSQQAE
jgi:hypothetical protein